MTRAVVGFDSVQLPLEGSDGRDPPKRFRIWPFGEVKTTKGTQLLTARSRKLIEATVTSRGVRYAADYEHDSVLNEQRARPLPGYEIPASCHFDPVFVGDGSGPEDGLYADNCIWTDKAAAMIRAGEKGYFSPAYWFDKESREITGFTNFALVMSPATLQIQPLTTAILASTTAPDLDDAPPAAPLPPPVVTPPAVPAADVATPPPAEPPPTVPPPAPVVQVASQEPNMKMQKGDAARLCAMLAGDLMEYSGGHSADPAHGEKFKHCCDSAATVCNNMTAVRKECAESGGQGLDSDSQGGLVKTFLFLQELTGETTPEAICAAVAAIKQRSIQATDSADSAEQKAQQEAAARAKKEAEEAETQRQQLLASLVNNLQMSPAYRDSWGKSASMKELQVFAKHNPPRHQTVTATAVQSLPGAAEGRPGAVVPTHEQAVAGMSADDLKELASEFGMKPDELALGIHNELRPGAAARS